MGLERLRRRRALRKRAAERLGVLYGLSRALRQKRQHRMRRVAEQRNRPVTPASQRRSAKERPAPPGISRRDKRPQPRVATAEPRATQQRGAIQKLRLAGRLLPSAVLDDDNGADDRGVSKRVMDDMSALPSQSCVSRTRRWLGAASAGRMARQAVWPE